MSNLQKITQIINEVRQFTEEAKSLQNLINMVRDYKEKEKQKQFLPPAKLAAADQIAASLRDHVEKWGPL